MALLPSNVFNYILENRTLFEKTFKASKVAGKIENLIYQKVYDEEGNASLEELDLLYVDTEGYDGKIVIDFLMNTNLKPIIIFEYIHINNKTFNTLLLKLNDANYKIFSIY